jgi:hypothetical protein
MPIIAAAVKHYRSETDSEELEDVLLGTSSYVSVQAQSGAIVGGWQRQPDGVFRSRPDLSAAIWLEQLSAAEPMIRFWQSPGAARPLPASVASALSAARA